MLNFMFCLRLILTIDCCFLFSIDASTSSGCGRMVNDHRHGNAKMKKVFVDRVPHLCLFATSEIQPGDELRYDYDDDTSRLFWRHKVKYIN